MALNYSKDIVLCWELTHKLFLNINNILARFRYKADVSAVCLKNARAGIILQIRIQNAMTQMMDVILIFNREDNFNTVIEIASHEVRAAEIDIFPAIIMEIK